MELKDFQDEPSYELADKVYQLGKEAREVYGERIFGDFLMNQSFLYRSGGFRADFMAVMDMLKQKENEVAFEGIDFKPDEVM